MRLCACVSLAARTHTHTITDDQMRVVVADAKRYVAFPFRLNDLRTALFRGAFDVQCLSVGMK